MVEFRRISYVRQDDQVRPSRKPRGERMAVPDRIGVTRIVAAAEMAWPLWDVAAVVCVKRRGRRF